MQISTYNPIVSLKKLSKFEMKNLILTAIAILGIGLAYGQEPQKLRSAHKQWINNERLSFCGDSASLLPEITAHSNVFYILSAPDENKKIRVFKLQKPAEYLLIYPSHAFIYQGQTNQYIAVSAQDEMSNVKQELYHLQKTHGYSLATTRHKETVLVIYDKLPKRKKLP